MLPDYQSHKSSVLLCPSILSADFAALGEAVERVAHAADIIHVDVMDGHFVPNMSIGPPVVKALRSRTKLPLDVHLMISDPMQWLEPFAESGADSLVIHYEAEPHLLRAVQRIRDLGCTPGLAINPGTPLSVLEEVLPYLDLVLLMTVNPGFGGQTYLPTMTDKIRRLRQLLDEKELNVHVQVDGGIHAGNVRELTDAGANLIVVGSAVFGREDPVAALDELKQCVRS